MRPQAERDEQTVAIGTALGVFAAVVMAAGLVTWLLHTVSRVVDGHEETLMTAAFLVAAVAAVAHLVRFDRR